MKKVLLITLALVFTLTLALPVLASERATPLIQDVPVSLRDIQTNEDLSDCEKVMKIIQLLFEVKREQISDEQGEDYDFAAFWPPDVGNSENINNFVRVIMARKQTFAAARRRAANSRTELTFNNIQIDEDMAVVDVYEWFAYTYYFLDDELLMDEESGEGTPYRVTLRKDNGNWCISDIAFESRFLDALRDPSLSVEEFVAECREAATAYIPSETKIAVELPVAPRRLPSRKTLDTSRVVTYAKKYAESRNPLFYNYGDRGGDCQNYASQCIWYGLGGVESATAVNNHNFPMVGPSISSRQWYNDGSGNHSGSWTAVGDFANYVKGGATSFVGLYGSVTSGIANAEVGDIIQVRENGEDSYSHSYVVVKVTGIAGYRTLENIWVCAHSKDVLNGLLSDQGMNGSTFRTVHVEGIYT